MGCPIYGTYGGRSVPVQFSLPGGNDPYSLNKVPPATTIPVGAAPIIFLYNNTNSAGLGATSGGIPILRDISSSNAAQVWDGTQGGAAFLNPALANVPLTILQNEPSSGAMNTAEFTTFRTFLAPKFAAPTNSQETGVNLGNTCALDSNCPNPLYLPTTNGGGVRQRAIGTDDMISGAGFESGGIARIPDSIGYALFSFGNVNPMRGTRFGGHGRRPLRNAGRHRPDPKHLHQRSVADVYRTVPDCPWDLVSAHPRRQLSCLVDLSCDNGHIRFKPHQRSGPGYRSAERSQQHRA
ncbi:MAG TPA: hypothetical protein VJX69_09200 [Terriglobales bacterium]|nr:hypothetical protein [Terriglobales bacterium]